MSSPRGPRPDRALLQVLRLEDRITPGIDPSTPILHVGTADYAGDRVIVSMYAGVSGGGLWSAPFAAAVNPVGFDIYSVRLKPGTNPNAATAYYSGRPGVQAAELDRIIRPTRVPNDPSYPALYGPAHI